MEKVLIATRNRHKVQEIRALLGPRFEILSLDGFPDAPTPEENATTFAGNATIKAVVLANWLATHHAGKIDFVLADDSGLEVDALKGAPGVHSARFANLDTGSPGNSSDAQNNDKLLRLMKEVPLEQRTARFRCAIAWTPVPTKGTPTASSTCQADEAETATRIFEGTCEGFILTFPRGKKGFGYDPLFVPRGYSATFAELGEEVKNRLSHRAQALHKVRKQLG